MKRNIFKLTYREEGFCKDIVELSSLCVYGKVRKPEEQNSDRCIAYFLPLYNLVKRLFATEILFIERAPEGASEDDNYQLVKALYTYRYLK